MEYKRKRAEFVTALFCMWKFRKEFLGKTSVFDNRKKHIIVVKNKIFTYFAEYSVKI